MMDTPLNDDAVDDLGDGRTVALPGTPDADKPDALVIINQNADAEDTEQAVRELDQYHATLQTVVDGVTRLHDMDEVTDMVLSSESIGQRDVMRLMKHYPMLSVHVAETAAYTETPSRTNLAATQRYVEREHTAQKLSLTEQFKIFASENLAKIQHRLDRMMEHHLPELQHRAMRLSEQAVADQSVARDSRRFLRYAENGKTLLDLRLQPLSVLASMKEALPGFPSLGAQALDRILRSDEVSKLVAACMDPRSPQTELLLRQSSDDHYSPQYLHVVGFHAANLLAPYLENTLVTLQAEHAEAMKTIEGWPDQLDQQLYEVCMETQTLLRKVLALHAMATGAYGFLHWSEVVMDGFRTFNQAD